MWKAPSKSVVAPVSIFPFFQMANGVRLGEVHHGFLFCQLVHLLIPGIPKVSPCFRIERILFQWYAPVAVSGNHGAEIIGLKECL